MHIRTADAAREISLADPDEPVVGEIRERERQTI